VLRVSCLSSLLLLVGTVAALGAAGLDSSRSKFSYRDASGQMRAVPVVKTYWKKRIVYPHAKVDPKIDPKLRHAATIAEERAHARSKARCWHYVKNALLAAEVIPTFPRTAYARDAGAELVHDYGFRRLATRDPYAAPVGAVIVYGRGGRGYGHVELRTRDGFVSDYFSKHRCRYPLLGVYVKR
jgi:hypothetical protein